MVHYVTQTPYKVFIRSLHRYNTHVGHVLLNSHQVSRSFSSELRPQGPALPLDGWVFVLQLRLCLIRREVRADNRLAGCITEWLIIALLLLRLITFFKIRLLVQSHRWANWGESKSEASTNHRGAIGTIGHRCPAEAQRIPLKYIYYWYVGSVQPCTSTTLRSHQKLKILFFPPQISKHQQIAVHEGNQWGGRKVWASPTHYEFGSEAWHMLGFIKHSSRKALPTRTPYFTHCVPTLVRQDTQDMEPFLFALLTLFNLFGSLQHSNWEQRWTSS